ncbi:hypothetical protein HZA99_04250 [Candidatus Woesearchaeota archaeon]|nr:hypothetical protein [Candidatus Woesearchaeota archaeon]
MTFKIIADRKTTQETIDQLIAEIPGLFPITVGISLVDSGERYDAAPLLRPLPRSSRAHHYLSPPIAGEYLDGHGYLDVAEIEEILPLARSPETVLITHHSFAFSPRSAGDFFQDFLKDCDVSVVGHFGRTFYFAGEYSRSEKRVVLGLVNTPDENNVKITAHELGHQYIRENCESYLLPSGRACLMNPSGPTATDVAAVSMTFCGPCYAKLGIPIRVPIF